MNSIRMTMINPALSADPTTIYAGVTAALNIALFNETGGNITLGRDANLEIFLPIYFTAAQIQEMSIQEISQDGWSFSYDSTDMSLLLSRNDDNGNWAANTQLAFTITGVLASASADSDVLQINFNGLAGSNIPPQLSGTLALVDAPAPGNLDLQDMLSIETDNGGVVYISTSSSPLSNTLTLNLKNIGTSALYHGAHIWTGTPRVSVSFVYGTTSGSLAPDNKQEASDPGSAWAITGALAIDQTDGWTIQNPAASGQANSPSWTLAPASNNQEIIGTGDKANVSFTFSNVISQTPAGPTQMYVQFSGFMANDNTRYNDRVFVLSLNKQSPPNPGLLGIYCSQDSIQVQSATEQIPVPLHWDMFGVGSVKLEFYTLGVFSKEYRYKYDTAHPTLNYDSQAPLISGITSTQNLTVYCSAYSDTNCLNLLNKGECTVPLIFPPVINSFSIATAPIVPPASYAFQLTWDIAGETSFEIIAEDNVHPPVVLPVSKSLSSYIVTPTSPTTTYTLNVQGNTSWKDQNLMSNSQPFQATNVSAQVSAVITMPVGTIVSFLGSIPPEGWLVCNGDPIDVTHYPNLFPLVINGHLPDLRSRFIVGAGQGVNFSDYSLNQTGGYETITLDISQIPPHRHTINNGDFGTHHRSFEGEDSNDHPFETSPSGPNLGGTDYIGDGKPHENRPPYYALSYIIKY